MSTRMRMASCISLTAVKTLSGMSSPFKKIQSIPC
jgi:hypothetical protein